MKFFFDIEAYNDECPYYQFKRDHIPSLNLVPIKPHNHKLSGQKVENGTKDESHQRTREDDDVVRHAKIRRGEIDKQGTRVDAAIFHHRVGTVITANRCNDSRR